MQQATEAPADQDLATAVHDLQTFARLMKWVGALLAGAAIGGWLKVAIMIYDRGQTDGSIAIRLDRTESDTHDLEHRIERLESMFILRKESP